MTYAKAKLLPAPGDHVYIIDGWAVVALPVVKIHRDCISVPGGFLYYEDIRDLWWLTLRGDTDAMKGSR